MKKSIYTYQQKINKNNYLFMLYIFKYRYLFNSIVQPHLRNITKVSTDLNSYKYKTKVISEI